MGVVYLIRHAQASFGAADYDKLSAIGDAQSHALGQALRPRIARVHGAYAGAMLRHAQTAQGTLAAWIDAPPLQILSGFDEFDHTEMFARWKPAWASPLRMKAELALTLQPRDAFQRAYEQAMQRWVSGAHDAEYHETWGQFRARCVAALDQVAARTGASQAALVFTSGGPIGALAQHLLGLPDDRVFALNRTLVNAAVTKVVLGAAGPWLATLNDHSHFEADRRLLTYR